MPIKVQWTGRFFRSVGMVWTTPTAKPMMQPTKVDTRAMTMVTPAPRKKLGPYSWSRKRTRSQKFIFCTVVSP